MANDKGKTYRKVGLADARSKKDVEKIFLSNPADAVAIYQLRNDESTRDRRFEPLAHLQASGLTVERACYEAVYTADLPRICENELHGTPWQRIQEDQGRLNLHSIPLPIF